MGVRYGQLKGTIGKINGESRTPPFSHIRKHIGRLDVGADQDKRIAAPDPQHFRIPAADAAGSNRDERTGKSGEMNREPVSWGGACHL